MAPPMIDRKPGPGKVCYQRSEPPNTQYCTSQWTHQGRNVLQRIGEVEFESSEKGRSEGYRAPFYETSTVTAPPKPERTLDQLEAILRVTLPDEIRRIDFQRQRANAIIIPDDEESSLPPTPDTPRRQTNKLSAARVGLYNARKDPQLPTPPSSKGEDSDQQSLSTSDGSPTKSTRPTPVLGKRKMTASTPLGTPQKKSKPSPNPPTPSPSPVQASIVKPQGAFVGAQTSTLNLLTSQCAQRSTPSPHYSSYGPVPETHPGKNDTQPVRVIPTGRLNAMQLPQMRQSVQPEAAGNIAMQSPQHYNHQPTNVSISPAMRAHHAAQQAGVPSAHQMYNGQLQMTPRQQHGLQMRGSMPTPSPIPQQQQLHMRQCMQTSPEKVSQAQAQAQAQAQEDLADFFRELQAPPQIHQDNTRLQTPFQNAPSAYSGSPHQQRSSQMALDPQHGTQMLTAPQQLMQMSPELAQPAQQQQFHNGQTYQPGQQHGTPITYVPHQQFNMPAASPQIQQRQQFSIPVASPQVQQRQKVNLPTAAALAENMSKERNQMLAQQQNQVRALSAQFGTQQSSPAAIQAMQRLQEFQHQQKSRLADRQKAVHHSWQQAGIRARQQAQRMEQARGVLQGQNLQQAQNVQQAQWTQQAQSVQQPQAIQQAQNAQRTPTMQQSQGMQQAQRMRQGQNMPQVQGMQQVQRMQQAQHIQHAQNIQQAQAMQQAQHIQQAQNTQQVQRMQQGQNVPQIQNIQQSQGMQPSQGMQQAQRVQQAQHIQQAKRMQQIQNMQR